MLPTLKNLDSFKDRIDFLQLTKNQIDKDFDRIGIEREKLIVEIGSFDNLIDWLNPTINRLLECHSEKIFALFYLIDIPEKAIRAVLDDYNSQSVSLDVTKLIVERELLKVLTRAYFSNQL